MYDIAAAGEKIIQERDQQRLTRIIKRDRRVTLPQIVADFNAGPSKSVTVRTIQRNIIYIGFWSQRLTRRQNTKLYASPGPTRKHRHWTVDGWKHVAWSDESRF
ncbi:HTH_Tnp_Tc3_2 domain-containing protein [Trichonephila clavipes]|nr:HTH_Tnp_Tc3_2 domain-containing protein [Trichonephila clavipes]